MFARLVRLIRTVRYLRPVQIYGRLWFRFFRPRPDLRLPPPIRPTSRALFPVAARPPSQLRPQCFRFLNQTGVLQCPGDWNAPGKDKLWLYNLHYFDDLTAQAAASRATWHQPLISLWIAENPPGRGNGWEPYPTSLRIVNWVKWALLGNTLSPHWAASLAVQTRWLTRRMEWHLLGNHLFANAKALVFAGLFFQGKEADAWLEKGLGILKQQLPEQILADGGQFELSPMYHALALEDLLDLINITQAYDLDLPKKWRILIAQWPRSAQKMQRWLLVMCHPDGQFALFNDAALGVAPTPDVLAAYAQRLGLGMVKPVDAGLLYLPESGYVRVQRDGALALLDVAAIGPDYLPGHAHADSLSFELSIRGQRCIVHSGTSLYGTGPERLRQRATAAHNTVEVDGENSSEVWGGFRVARRARPQGLTLTESSTAITVACGHDGYLRLAGKVTHRREWHFSAHSMCITDRLSGHYAQAIARFHFHPDILLASKGTKGRLTLPNGVRVYWQHSLGQARLVSTSYHPEFGLSVANQCLEIIFSGPCCEIVFSWHG